VTRRRAAVLVLPGVDSEKQERAVLGYIAERRYVLTSVSGDHRAVLALVEAGLIEVVVAAFETRGVRDLECPIVAASGRLEVVRPRVRRHPAERHALRIRQAAGRGATPEMIAAVLDLPLEVVLAALGLRPVRSGGGR
jgi:hypothetical protein